MKLFLLGHAGGSPAAYVPLFSGLGRSHELVPLDLPGHGRRMGEALLRNIDDMVDDLGRILRASVKCDPFALFGHSMGGILAHALAAHLDEMSITPAHVVISSTCTPGRHHIPPQFPSLGDRELWRESSTYFGGMPDQIAASPELMTLFAPVLRADLGAVLNYSPPTLPAIDAPVTAICGHADIVDREDMEVWRRHTTADCTVQVLTGSHFHLLERPDALETLLWEVLGQS